MASHAGVQYCGSIPNGLEDGKVVEIKGKIPYGAEVFEVNFLTGMDSDYSDRPFHLSVRFNIRVAVRNTYLNNNWQNEERHGIFPFFHGQEFTMTIRVQANCYKIAVNNQHCWDFVHRIPFYRVSTLHIKGSVSVDGIRFLGSNYPTTTCQPSYPAYPNPVPQKPPTTLSPVYNPCIPYAYPMYGGVRPGMMIYISGKPTANPYRFTINIQDGTSPYNPPDIAFHFDVRFFNRTIVRNTRVNNSWQHEETQVPNFPFMANGRFDMIIRVTKNQYMVAVNGQHFVEYRHRLRPLTRFDTLYIESDISVQSIRFG